MINTNTSLSGYLKIAVIAVSLMLMNAVAMAEKINLNQADAETLQYIPGIGPGKSQKIVAAREQRGAFESVDDLLAVPGVGESLLKQIKHYGSVNEGVSSLTDEMRANPPARDALEKSAKSDDQAS
ncbi:MAG: helix-hairpin-helix domain-containing protein [Pseudomonadota bacterium]